MVHVPPGLFQPQAVQLLALTHGTQRCDVKHLGGSAGKQRRAMGAWQHAHLTGDRPYLFPFAAIRPFAVYNAASQRPRVNNVESRQYLVFLIVIGKFGQKLRLQSRRSGLLLLLGMHIQHTLKTGATNLALDSSCQFFQGSIFRVKASRELFDYFANLGELKPVQLEGSAW